MVAFQHVNLNLDSIGLGVTAALTILNQIMVQEGVRALQCTARFWLSTILGRTPVKPARHEHDVPSTLVELVSRENAGDGGVKVLLGEMPWVRMNARTGEPFHGMQYSETISVEPSGRVEISRSFWIPPDAEAD